MRKALLFIVLLAIPSTILAQSRDIERGRDGRYSRYYRDDRVEITPFGGFRWGGTLYADRTDLFGFDVDVASAANYGANLGIPLGGSGMKLELMANRQDTHLTAGGGLFTPNDHVADIHITYYHAGILMPFAQSQNATPFIVLSAGAANLKPDVPGISSDTRFSASAGAGVKLPISDNLSVRLEARGYFTSLGKNRYGDCYECNHDAHDLFQGETNIGLAFSF